MGVITKEKLEAALCAHCTSGCCECNKKSATREREIKPTNTMTLRRDKMQRGDNRDRDSKNNTVIIYLAKNNQI